METSGRWSEGVWEFIEDGETGDIYVKIRDEGGTSASQDELYFGNAEGNTGTDYWNGWLVAHARAMYDALNGILGPDAGGKDTMAAINRAELLLAELNAGPFDNLRDGKGGADERA
jgi:hypothetical protein